MSRGEAVAADRVESEGEGEDLEFDLASLDPRARYFLLTGVVVPRPIGWISTLDAVGRRNLAPFSYFNACSATPPIVHFTPTGPKDTLANARATGEFVANVVSEDLAEAMRITSATFRPDGNEFEWAGLESAPSLRVSPPRVAAARVSLECRVRHILEMGEGTLVFGDVLHIHVKRSVWRNERVDHELLRPVGRLSGLAYATVKDVYRLEMPEWVEEEVGDYRIQEGSAGQERGDEKARA